MKTLIPIILFLALTGSATAQTVSFAWDPHPEAAALAGFKLYQSKTSMSYGATPVATFIGGTLATGTIAKPGLGKYFYVLTAYTVDVESDFSNEVSLVVKPKAPKLNSAQQVAQAIKDTTIKVAGLFKGKEKGLRVVKE